MKEKRLVLKRWAIGFLAMVLVLPLLGCTENEAEPESQTTEVLEVKYSNGFSVEYLEDGIKKMEDADGRVIMMVPDGEKLPEEYENADVILEGDLETVMTASSTQVCLLRAVDELDAIVAVTNDRATWTIEEIPKAMDAGKIAYVGNHNAPDYELITSLNPSLVFVYSGNSGQFDLMAKLDELNINYIVCNEYMEDDPRGRMEWMKIYGALFNKERIANAFFDRAVKNIDEVMEKAEKQDKPKVVWGMVNDGKVYVPGNDSYVGKMIEMCGGDYVFKDMKGAGSSTITLEEFYAGAKDAEIMIYSSMEAYTPNIEALIETAPIMENIKAVQDNKVWCLGDDFYQSIDLTDAVISDLYSIFHEDGETTHYKKY